MGNGDSITLIANGGQRVRLTLRNGTFDVRAIYAAGGQLATSLVVYPQVANSIILRAE